MTPTFQPPSRSRGIGGGVSGSVRKGTAVASFEVGSGVMRSRVAGCCDWFHAFYRATCSLVPLFFVGGFIGCAASVLFITVSALTFRCAAFVWLEKEREVEPILMKIRRRLPKGMARGRRSSCAEKEAKIMSHRRENTLGYKVQVGYTFYLGDCRAARY